MTDQEERLACAVGAPHAHGPVYARGDDALAVRAKGRRQDGSLLMTKDQRLARAIDVPDPRDVVGRRDDALAVGAHRGRKDAALVPLNDERALRPLGAP